MVLTDITHCSIAAKNNNITIYNRATICEWQSAIIAHVTFIVLLPAGLECWHALTGKVWLEEPCCLSPSPPAGKACECTLGVGLRWEETDGERERVGERIESERMQHPAISIVSISLWICKPDRSSRHQWLSSPWNSRREEERRERSAPLWCFHPIMVNLSVAWHRYLCVCARLCVFMCMCMAAVCVCHTNGKNPGSHLLKYN